MSQHDSPLSFATPVTPVVSDLFASYSDAQGFWVKEPSVPTTKAEEEATIHPLPSSLLHVDIARELRSAQYRRNKAKDEAKLVRARESKGHGRPRRGHPTQRSKGTKRSGKRQPIPQDSAAGSETDYEGDPSDRAFLERRDAVPDPVELSENRHIPTPVSPEMRPPTEKAPKGCTPPDAYTATALPESPLGIPAPDIAREFRSYERHRHLAKKNARFTQSRQKRGPGVKPVRGRNLKLTKTENLRSLLALTIADEVTSSEDEIQTPVEVSLSVILPDLEYDAPAPLAVDMEALITTAKVKLTKGSFISRFCNITVTD